MRRRLREADNPFLAFMETEIRREADLRGWMVERIELAAPPNGGRWLDYRRNRAYRGNERRATARRGVGFKVTFAGPVTGPVVLGGLSHLGLGLFSVSNQDAT